MQRTDHLVTKLSAAGMQLSSTDRFVIAASGMLIAASAAQLSFEQIKARLEDVRARLEEESTDTAVAQPDGDHRLTVVE